MWSRSTAIRSHTHTRFEPHTRNFSSHQRQSGVIVQLASVAAAVAAGIREEVLSQPDPLP
jgi:hypothetical protein